MAKITLPEGIDPATPAGDLTTEQLESIHALVTGYKRWRNVGKRARRKQASLMGKARLKAMTKAERRAVAAMGGLARQAKRREQEKAEREPVPPPTPLS